MWYEKCDRCQKGDENRYKGERRAARIKFCGGHWAVICPECQNDWAERIPGTEVHRQFDQLEIEFAAHVRNDRTDEAHASYEQRNAIDADLRAMAMAFVAEAVTREDPEADA